MTLEGIDVSYAQTHTPSLVGKSFAFAKATEGTTVDPKYAYHAANIKAAGIVQGAYHYGVKGSIVPIAAQVTAFLTTAGSADLLALDVEGLNEPSDAEAQAFINAVRAKGRKCGLYHSLSGFPTSVSADFRWIAKYSTTPPSIAWQFWQYTNMGTQYGLDLDKFNGTLAQLEALAGKVGSPVGIKVKLAATASTSAPWASFGTAKTAKACLSNDIATGAQVAFTTGADIGVVQLGTLEQALGPWPVGTAVVVTNINGEAALFIKAEVTFTPLTPPTASGQTVTVTGQGLKVTGP